MGTVDGANIEIRDEIGNDNIWLFGALAHEVDDIRHKQRFSKVEINPHLDKVVKTISRGDFGDAAIFDPLLGNLFTCLFQSG